MKTKPAINKNNEKKLGTKWRRKTTYPYEIPLENKTEEPGVLPLAPHYERWLGTHKTILKKSVSRGK